jgi:hypothetical protein
MQLCSLWTGSAREHFNQIEIQLAQMKRLHQIQDEYVQCLSRNDELLVNQDLTLQVTYQKSLGGVMYL